MMSTVTKHNKIYGNWKVLSPDGHLMFRCDTKKANWYLKRNLASVTENESTIKLNFNPKGLGNHDKDYGLSEIDNICVICGIDEFLTRHHVVPYCYRRFFPMEKKSHNFHDVLSLCVNCHEKYEKSAFEYKLELANKYNAPINGELYDNRELFRIKRICICLIGEMSFTIPNNRIFEIKEEIRKYFSWKYVTKKRLKNFINKEVKLYNRTHGEIVISKIDDIDSFIYDWRCHFIEKNDCRFLPENWSIDYE